MMSPNVQGPTWSPLGLDDRGGRYPLSVERHVMAMVEKFVPGVTTQTLHARYYALHGLVAIESENRDLDLVESLELLRRIEVIFAGISILHEHEGLPRAHGADAVGPFLENNSFLDVATLSTPRKGHYSERQNGFWGTYRGSEIALGIVSSSRIPTPGERCDESAIYEDLGELIGLASKDRLSIAELKNSSHLCLCQTKNSSDGVWLRSLFLSSSSSSDDPFSKADDARVSTIKLLAASLDEEPTIDFAESFRKYLGYGPFIYNNEVEVSHDAASAWQGVILRRNVVGAWRRIWAHIVNRHIFELATVDEIATAFASELPNQTVDEFLTALPAGMESGYPVDAEAIIRLSPDSLVAQELSILAIGGFRVKELSGRTREAFLGNMHVELGPEWIARRFERNRSQQLQDFGNDLASDLIARALRIAMLKMERQRNGKISYPSRIQEKGGYIFRKSTEGSGNIGLRINQLGQILTGVGVFEMADGALSITPLGREALGG